VLKPAEETPLTSIRFAELAREAGFPDGVVSVVTGDGGTGPALVAHKGVNKIMGQQDMMPSISGKASRST
jgi:acyl-CoA reductase-like NAD-dependent aldehyde dehydrogenase